MAKPKRVGDGVAARASKQNGQVVPLMAGVLVLVAMLAVGAAGLGFRVVGRARAQNAADAAALAAAVEPDDGRARAVAARLAAGNGAELVSFRRASTTVVVVVEIAHRRATAAAEPVPDAAGEGP